MQTSDRIQSDVKTLSERYKNLLEDQLAEHIGLDYVNRFYVKKGSPDYQEIQQIIKQILEHRTPKQLEGTRKFFDRGAAVTTTDIVGTVFTGVAFITNPFLGIAIGVLHIALTTSQKNTVQQHQQEALEHFLAENPHGDVLELSRNYFDEEMRVNGLR